jgi:ribonuclease P protein subunit POP4
MRVTPNIINSEFIGTETEVSSSRHDGYVGITGEIVSETRNIFKLMHNGKPKSIVKDQAVFNFKYSDGTVVEIDGKLLVGRPEDRLKKSIKRLW